MALNFKQELIKKLESDTLVELGMDDQFIFQCNDDCMGRCCNTITILLDPWDVETMTRHLGISGQDFIKEYCAYDLDTQTRWPFFRLRHVEHGPCVFMLEDGKCRLYPARSRNCRTYPLGRAVRIEYEGDQSRVIEKIFMVERQKFCLGHKTGRRWTVREWFEDADAFKYYELSDLYIELINYAATHLDSRRWMSDRTVRTIMPLLFGPEVLRAKLGVSDKEVGHEEFYRRRMKALRVILTDLAAGFGFGPLAAQFMTGETPAMSMMDRVKTILQTGEKC